MADKLTIDKSRSVLLCMDLQSGIVGMLPETGQKTLLDNASAALAAARRAGMAVIHIVVRFKSGHPEVSPRNKMFSEVKKAGFLVEGTPIAEIHPRVAPAAAEPVLAKLRVGAFSTTALETLLRTKNIDTLVLCGFSTSGVVLSTVRWAADMDYRLVVVADACADPDAEVHRMLVDKVFPAQADVLSARDLVAALA